MKNKFIQKISMSEGVDEVWNWKQLDLSNQPDQIEYVEPSMPWITFFMRKEERQTSQGAFTGYHVYKKLVDEKLKKLHSK